MIIRLKGIHKSYNSVRALNGVELETPEGAIGLLGPNGAGKTTLLKTLLGLVKIDRGTGAVLDCDIKKEQLRLRQQVGYMPEIDCHIPGMDGISYVAYCGELAGMHRSDAKKRAHEVLDYAGLSEARYREVQTYSTGMKQRIKLAQALVHHPRILFLDEPTSGMDPQGRENMLELIYDLSHKNNISVLLSSHILPDVEQVCDHIVIIGRGKILANDNLARLKVASEKYYEVRLRGESEGTVIQSLTRLGYAIEPQENKTLKVTPPAGANVDSTRQIFQAAAEHKVQVRQLTRSKNTLEQIFLNAVEGN